MAKFRQFWPLYLLYAVEFLIYLITCAAFLVGKFLIYDAVDQPTFSEEMAALFLQIILAAPVIFGFFSRRHFVKGLWLTYAWVGAYLSVNSGWTALAVVFGHAFIVTFVLLFTRSGRDYFVEAPASDDQVEEPATDFRFERSAEAFLRARRTKIRPPSRSSYQTRLMQGYWIGAALMAWGAILRLPEFASLGFVVVLVCFMLHRRARGNYKIFFRHPQPRPDRADS